jgi:Ser-tRNA(Ala) deacylase AlaX
MTTKLLYMEQMQLLNSESQVTKVVEEDGKTIIELDETIFYPQGGGQPYDQGKIKSESGIFKVEEVRYIDGIVKHIGQFESGSFAVGDKVKLEVDEPRRFLHMRLHSAGHVLDMAVNKLGMDWVPGKGYHFPDGPYVEYKGELSEEIDREKLKTDIETVANEFIGENITTAIKFMPKEEMHTICRHVPDYLPEGKPARVVLYGTFGVPCGGTHVANIKDVGHLVIRKVGMKNGFIKVSYNID